MTALLAVALGLAIGTVLGGLGGGGAILTVPVLVYLLGQSAQEATTGSLVIVGITAVIGALGHARSGRVRWGSGAAFGAVGILAAYAGTQANRHVDEHLLLLGFAAVMVLAAIGMLLGGRRGTGGEETRGLEPQVEAHEGGSSPTTATPGGTTTGLLVRPTARRRPSATVVGKVLVAGLAVGFMTGFFGVGGGFVVVPALVLVLRFPMPAAVGTSLLVIAINSAASLASRAGHLQLDWTVVAPFTSAAVVGTFAGQRAAARVSGATLSRGFAVLLLLVAAYVGVQSAGQLLG